MNHAYKVIFSTTFIISFLFLSVRSKGIPGGYPKCLPRQEKIIELQSSPPGDEKIVQFYSFGTSHVVCGIDTLLSKSGNIKWFNNWSVLNRMYKVVSNGLGFLNVQKQFNPPPHSIFLFGFGSIDLEFIFFKENTEKYQKLVSDYEKILLENQALLSSPHFWIQGIPPPFKKSPAKVIFMNSFLKEMAARNNWFYLDTFTNYSTIDGEINLDLSDSWVHIASYLLRDQELVSEKIEEIRSLKE